MSDPAAPIPSSLPTQPRAGKTPHQPAIGFVRPHVLLWTTACLGLVADLWTKYWAWGRYYTELGPPPQEVIIPGLLQFTAVENRGALFGMGQGYVLFFIVASLGAIGVVLALFAQSDRRHTAVHLANGLILAGALGNLYDRYSYGYVRDFLHVYTEVNLFGQQIALWPWVFNVADMMLVTGVSTMVLLWYVMPTMSSRRRRRRRERQAAGVQS